MLILDYDKNTNLVLLSIKTYDNDTFNELKDTIKKIKIFTLKFIKERNRKYYVTSPRAFIENDILKYLNKITTINYRRGTLELIEKENNPIKALEIRRVLYKSNITLKPPLAKFQEEDIKFLIQRNVSLNANSPGLGKTYETIANINHKFDSRELDKILIITINPTKYNWKKELLDFSGYLKKEDILIAEDKIYNPFDYKDKKVIITGYEFFRSIMKYYGKVNNKNTQSKTFRNNQIPFESWCSFDKALLILDEAHKIKNYKSQTFKTIKLIRDYFKYRNLLTATPWPNIIVEIWPLMYMIDPSVFGENYKNFEYNVAKLGKKIGSKYFENEIDHIYPHKEDEIREKIKPYIIRRFKTDKDVKEQLNLPEQTTKPIYVESSIKQIEIYKDIISRELALIKDQESEIEVRKVKNKFQFLLQACSDPGCLKNKFVENDFENLYDRINNWEFKENAKIKALNDIISYHKNEKIIIWCYHPYTLDKLEEYYLKNKNKKSIVIHGERDQGNKRDIKRDELLDSFRYNKDCNLAFLSARSVSAGINLQQATVSVWWDVRASILDYNQGKDRNYRAVSTKDVINYMLLLDGTLEESMYDLLTNKDYYDKFFMNKDIFEKRSLNKDQWNKIFTGKIKSIFNEKKE